MSDTVFDANCWGAYVDDQLQNSPGIATQSFAKAASLGSILFDSGHLVRQQYVQTRRGFGEQLFDIFFEKGVLSRTVRLVEVPASEGAHFFPYGPRRPGAVLDLERYRLFRSEPKIRRRENQKEVQGTRVWRCVQTFQVNSRNQNLHFEQLC